MPQEDQADHKINADNILNRQAWAGRIWSCWFFAVRIFAEPSFYNWRRLSVSVHPHELWATGRKQKSIGRTYSASLIKLGNSCGVCPFPGGVGAKNPKDS